MALIGAVLSWIGSTSILFICQYDQLRNQQSVPEVDADNYPNYYPTITGFAKVNSEQHLFV
jgi:hypothetical protein